LVVAWAGKVFFRFIKDLSNIDTDTFVALWQVGLVLFTFFIAIRYIQKAIQGLFEQTTLQSYIKTALLLVLSGSFTALISFVVSEGLR
jgi:hypothetical protein